MSKFTCKNGCCSMIVSKYDYNKNILLKKNLPKNKKKAGVFVYNPDKTKVLLVQSRGKYWGPPKGTLEENEDWEICAERELKEESGISLTENECLSRLGFIKSNAYYFTLEKNNVNITLQNVDNNDANGIGWFDVLCLKEMLRENKIMVNQHCKIGLRKIFNIEV